MKLSIDSLIEVLLKEPDDFLKVKETLTRIGIASRKTKILYQSCHILHKQGKYYIVHFKELFALDGKPTDFSDSDEGRRNTIVNLLAEWGLIKIATPDKTKEPVTPLSQNNLLPYKGMRECVLVRKYFIARSGPKN
jgi:hypothetical protein